MRSADPSAETAAGSSAAVGPDKVRATGAMAATAILAGVAFVLFGQLALRHVGESYFLADQVDQLQKFEALLRLDPGGVGGRRVAEFRGVRRAGPEGLGGPAKAGTRARALGPFGAVVFGLPVALGFGID